MALTGMIRKIGSYTDLEYEQMKKDLQLSMSLPFLRHIAKYYHAEAKRDPSIEEVQLLDAFVLSMQRDPGTLTPVQLNTDDSFVADTYADMMQKHRQLHPQSKTPLPLSRAGGLADAYLMRAGRRSAIPGLSVLSESGDPSFFKEGDAVESSLGHRIRPFRSQCHASSDDLLALYFPKAEPSGMEGTLWSDPIFSASVVSLSHVGAGGLLNAVLEKSHGAWIDLRRLTQTTPISWQILVNDFHGAWVLRISREKEAELVKKAAGYGLSLTVFAAVSDIASVSLCRDAKDILSLDASFLRSLISICPLVLTLSHETPEEITAPCTAPALQNNCQYLYRPAGSGTFAVSMSEVCACAVSASAPTGSFYLNSLYTGILSLAELSLSGAYYKDAALSVAMTLPKMPMKAQQAAAFCSATLGLYRLQAELGLPTVSRVLEQKEVDAPRCSVFSLAKASPLSSVFTGEGYASLLVCPVTETGMPDFDALRHWLDRLASMGQSGVLRAARSVCNTPISAVIKEMCHQRFIHQPEPTAPLAEPPLLAAVVETDVPIPDAIPLGRILADPDYTPTPDAPTELPEAESLIWSDKAEIVLLATEDDSDAKRLASALRLRGARVYLCSPDTPLILSRQLLGAHALIYCKNVTLPNTPEVNFAQSTMKAAGGRILSLGETPVENTLHFPRGLSEENLIQLVKSPI